MLVSIRAQHSNLQVLLPILPFTAFVATSLLLGISLTKLLPYATTTFDFVGSREYGYMPNFSEVSHFRFLTLFHRKAEICWRTFCQRR